MVAPKRRCDRDGRADRARRVAYALTAALLLPLPGCARAPMTPSGVDRGRVDRQAFRNTYIEEGSLVTLVVNTDATRRREKSPYVPLAIFLANNGDGPLTIGRESLSLVDMAGRRYPLASVEETRSLGNRTVMDLRASGNFFDIISRRGLGRPSVGSVFFPVSDPGLLRRGLVRDTIELPRGAWMMDVIYFPHPEGKLLGGRYELWLTARELEKPVFVRFEVK